MNLTKREPYQKGVKRKRTKPTDKPFTEWLSYQPSCLDGSFSECDEAGNGRNIGCHVSRAEDGGVAQKSLFRAVPMTFEQHAYQHQHGEAACLERYLGGEWSVEAAKAWFDRMADEYLAMWKS